MLSCPEDEDKRLARCVAACADEELAAILSVAGQAALAAGRILRDLYGKPHQVRHKGVIDLVTEADVAAEEAALSILTRYSGEIGLLAEESLAAYNGPPSGRVWVIDPLDGTTNFAHGFPVFAVSIAYAEGESSKVGVVYAPMQDELFCAVHGSGAWLNGRPIRVSEVTGLGEALLATGFPYLIEEEAAPVMAALGRLVTKCQGVRRPGAAAIDLAWLACGRTDGFWEINLKPWDTAAGILLVTEAGGRISTYAGNPWHPYLAEIIASNGLIHEQLAGELAGFTRI